MGGRTVTLYPIFHPAAALYTPAMLRTLEEDFARIPALLGRAAAAAPSAEVIELHAAAPPEPALPAAQQLDLF